MQSALFDPQHHLKAQRDMFSGACSEIRNGRKIGHWMWFVFPQLQGLGSSLNSLLYGLEGLQDARAYLNDPILSERLRTAVRLVIDHSLRSQPMFDEVDTLKFHASMTLMDMACPDDIFSIALDRFYDGKRHRQTIALLHPTAWERWKARLRQTARRL